MTDIIAKRFMAVAGNVAGEWIPVLMVDQGNGTYAEKVLAPDAGPAQTVTRTPFSSANCSVTPVDLTADPGASLKAVAMDIIVSVDTACRVSILTQSGSELLGLYMAANSTVQITPRGYIKGAAVHKKLQITTSVVAAIAGLCVNFTEA